MKFSVIIPAYNQAEFLGDAIRSVLRQTYGQFEVVVVNDASTDRTAEVLAEFSDPRLRVVTHSQNGGLSAARNTGIRETTGEVIALLDGDDLFCPEKLAEHVKFLQAHPEVGVSYNGRFELNHSQPTIREMWRAPATCELGALVMGFPFAPSDMVVRREWFSKVGLFDEELRFYSEDLDINCRLALAGCRFAGIDKPLNKRRYHSGRPLRVRERLEAAQSVLSRVFADPRCSPDVVAAQDAARAAHYLAWATYSFFQDDTANGSEFLRKAISLDPRFARNGILKSLLHYCIADGSRDHESDLKRIIDQFPEELRSLGDGWQDAAAEGYLRRAVTSAMWHRTEAAVKLFAKARETGAHPDAWMVGYIATHLINVEEMLGPEAAKAAIHDVEHVGRPYYAAMIREVKTSYFLNKSFRSYDKARYREVIGGVGKAVINDLGCLRNRGLLSVAIRSALRMLTSPFRRVYVVAG